MRHGAAVVEMVDKGNFRGITDMFRSTTALERDVWARCIQQWQSDQQRGR